MEHGYCLIILLTLCHMIKHLSFDLNLVNLLNQTGASGKIGIADLVEKEDLNGQYDNYVMSGTYIRPFTIEATAHLKF